MTCLKNFFVVLLLFVATSFVGKYIFAFYQFSDLGCFKISYAVFMGYQFDLALGGGIAFLTTLFVWKKSITSFFASLFTVASLAFQFGDCMYFSDAGRHASYEIFNISGNAKELLLTVLNEHLQFFVFGVLLLFFLFILFFLLLQKIISPDKITTSFPFKKLFVAALAFFFIRGCFVFIPLRPGYAYHLSNVTYAFIALNPTYNLIHTLIHSDEHAQQSARYETKDEVTSLQKLYRGEGEYTPYFSSPPNIILFFSESWSGMYFKSYGGKYNLVPRFEELLQRSVRPKGMLACGHRTNEGVFATLTSFQNPFSTPVAQSRLLHLPYRSLVNILHDEKGYSSAFFQGTHKECVGVGALAQRLGFQDSYGKYEVRERIYEQGDWGLQDKDLFNFALKKIEKMSKPFIIGINGATTHGNDIPSEEKLIHFVDDKKLNMRYNAFYYSDKWMYEFVKQVEKIYPNTLFVFFADHCGREIPKDSGFLNYLIPFALYSEKLPPKYIDEFVSQRDIAPTILDLTLGDYKKIAPHFTGKSIVRKNNFVAEYFHGGILGVVKDKIAVEQIGEQVRCYDVSTYRQREIPCRSDTQELLNEVKSFTNISQDLLFQGKTMEFDKYRNPSVSKN